MTRLDKALRKGMTVKVVYDNHDPEGDRVFVAWLHWPDGETVPVAWGNGRTPEGAVRCLKLFLESPRGRKAVKL